MARVRWYARLPASIPTDWPRRSGAASPSISASPTSTWSAPAGRVIRVGFVDVPGHERFVRNMLAGVGGIDVVLLVIAADESIKPQTREHFDICRMLALRRGITVITKSDLVDAETLDVVRMEAADFLKGSFLDPAHSPIVAVSSKTGAGLDHLREELARLAAEAPAKDSAAVFRLPIDRVFTMKGFGTVVTGTLISGTVHKDQEVQVHPGGKLVRVRGVQVHSAASEQAIAGQRTALNLAGIDTTELARGMMLTPPQLFQPTQHISVSLDLLRSRQAAARPRTRALPLLHRRDHRDRQPAWRKTIAARRIRTGTAHAGRPAPAAARRPIHRSAILAGHHHRRRESPGCGGAAASHPGRGTAGIPAGCRSSES